jgi:hypothetical protein
MRLATTLVGVVEYQGLIALRTAPEFLKGQITPQQ